MKRGVYVLTLVLCIVSVHALSVQNTVHSTTSGSGYIAIITPLSSLNTNDTLHNYTSAVLVIKVTKPLSSLSVSDYNHTVHSNELLIKVIERNTTRLIENSSYLYKDFIESLDIPTADVIIGKNQYDTELMTRYNAGMKNGFVKNRYKTGVYPFDSVIVSSFIDNKRKIFIYGNSLEGEVAGLRYLKKHLDEFVHMDYVVLLEDADGLSVYDYMHTLENDKWYNTETDEFRAIVNKSLFGKFDSKMIDVKTNDGIYLRAMQMKPLNTEKFINYSTNVTLPIVLARGLWSNLYAWQSFGEELADNGRAVYLIEITGGPGQDCNTCVNYDFNDLTLEYWPALIGTVQTIENGSLIQYVGHSNGARTGISSLEIYNEVGKENSGFYNDNGTWTPVSMSAYPIDTYIAVGMPGAFDGEQGIFGNIVKDNYDDILFNLDIKNETHKTFGSTFESYREKLAILIKGGDTISLNLVKDYFSWIKESNDTQPIASDIPKLVIITGTISRYTDGIVAIKDNDILFNTSNANQTHQYYLYISHVTMGEDKDVQYLINKELNNEEATSFKKQYYSYKEK